MQASHSLGFDDDIRSKVENAICREGGILPDCFDLPVHIVWRLIEEVLYGSIQYRL